MAVDTTEIDSVYNVLLGKITTTLKTEYDANRIDSDTYANMLMTMMQNALTLSVQSVQQQVTLEAQAAEILASTIRQDSLAEDTIATSVKQRLLLDEQSLKTQEEILIIESQNSEVLASTIRQDALKDDTILTSTKQRLLLDEQLIKTQEEIDLLQSQDLEILASTIRQDLQSTKDLEVKSSQIDIAERSIDIEQVFKEAQIDEIIDATLRANVQLDDVLLTSQKQRLSIDKDNLLKDDELVINEKKKDQLNAQVAEVIDGTIRANTQLDDSLLTSDKQRILLDTEEEAKQYEVDNILPAQLADINKKVDVAERSIVISEEQSVQDLLNKAQQVTSMIKDDEVKTKQALDIAASTKVKEQQELTEVQSTAKIAYEVSSLLPQQLIKLEEEVDLMQSQNTEVLASTIRNDADSISVINSRDEQSARDLLVKDEQIALIAGQSATELKQALDIIASTTLKNSQNSEVIASTTRQDNESSSKIELIDNQILDIVSQTTVRDEQSNKDLLVKDEQIAMSIAQQETEAKKVLDIVSTTAINKTQSDRDVLIKDQQELAEKIKNGVVAIEYTYIDTDDEEIVYYTTYDKDLILDNDNLFSMSQVYKASSYHDSIYLSDIKLKKEQIDLSAAKGATEAKQALDIAASTALKGSQKSEVLANTIRQNNESDKKVTLLSSQAIEVVASTIRMDEQSSKDLVVKESQIAKTNKDTIFVNSKNIEQLADTIRKDAVNTEQILQMQSQVDKIVADTSFTNTQEIELVKSVDYNNKIKALDSYSDMIGTIGAGSLKIDPSMWETYFNMVNGLNSDGTIPSSPDVTLAT